MAWDVVRHQLRRQRVAVAVDQQSVWQAQGAEGSAYGWGGNVGDLALANNGDALFTCISASGNAVFLTGQNAVQYQISRGGAVATSALANVNLSTVFPGGNTLADVSSGQAGWSCSIVPSLGGLNAVSRVEHNPIFPMTATLRRRWGPLRTRAQLTRSPASAGQRQSTTRTTCARRSSTSAMPPTGC